MLEEHKQTLGLIDWNSAIRFDTPGGKSQGPSYVATLNDTGLAAVRADVGVDMTECDVKVILGETVVPDEVAGTVGEYSWDDEAEYVLMVDGERMDDGESWRALFEDGG